MKNMRQYYIIRVHFKDGESSLVRGYCDDGNKEYIAWTDSQNEAQQCGTLSNVAWYIERLSECGINADLIAIQKVEE